MGLGVAAHGRAVFRVRGLDRAGLGRVRGAQGVVQRDGGVRGVGVAVLERGEGGVMVHCTGYLGSGVETRGG